MRRRKAKRMPKLKLLLETLSQPYLMPRLWSAASDQFSEGFKFCLKDAGAMKLNAVHLLSDIGWNPGLSTKVEP